MNEEIGTPASTETEEQVDETQEEEQVDWEAEAKKNKEVADNYKIRAEKAEKKAKEAPEKKVDDSSLSQTDFLYLAKSDIHEEDLGELNDVMSKMGMNAKQAHEYLKPRFAVKAEERKTASVTNTGSGRGKKPKTGEDYLDKANKTGELPDSDTGMQDLILARQNAKRGK